MLLSPLNYDIIADIKTLEKTDLLVWQPAYMLMVVTLICLFVCLTTLVLTLFDLAQLW